MATTPPSTETPDVAAYIEHSQTTGQQYAYVLCPFCQDRHMHGAGSSSGPADLGHRASHCLTGDGGGYRLVLGPPDMTMPPALSRREREKRLMADDRRRGLTY